MNRSSLDYGNLVYDQPNNDLLWQKFESMQDNATIAVTEGISGTCTKHEESYISNYTWDTLSLSVGFEGFVLYSKLKNSAYKNICSNLFPKKTIFIMHVQLLP